MDRKPEPQDETRFFEHGKVSFVARDFPSRTAALDITMPCCLFQTVVPQLLGAGFVDHPRIHGPIAVWMPQLTQERFNILIGGDPGASTQVNVQVRAFLEQLLGIFDKLGAYLKDPADLVPMLPLGVYVDFRWRCKIDDILKVMEGIDRIRVAGVPEFQWALACVLQCVLEDYANWERRLLAAPTAK